MSKAIPKKLTSDSLKYSTVAYLVPVMASSFWILSFIIVSGITFSIVFKKLTLEAALLGGILAFGMFDKTGFVSVATMTAFFITGTLVTSWKLRTKQHLGLAEADSGKRNAAQVFANAGAAGLVGLLALWIPLIEHRAPLMIAGCFAAATADTVSSELGNVYGKRFRDVTTLKTASRGVNGAISLEGTLLGVCGSILIAAVYAIWFGFSTDLVLIVLAGTFGNWIDSVLGATLEKKGILGNNAVNFLNTMSAALFLFFAK